MKLLVVNPNTSASMTEAVVARVQALVGPDATVHGVTAAFGFEVIASRSAWLVGGHAALDAWARAEERGDAVILACFGDPGVAALRELAPVPVVGLAEASIHAALARPGPFSIITAGAAWKPMLEELVASMGATSRLAEVIVLEGTGLAFAGGAAAAEQSLAAAVAHAHQRGAATVILGGAGFARIASTWPPRDDVIDCIAAAAKEAVARAGRSSPRAARAALPEDARRTRGLDPALAARIAAAS